MIKLTIPGKPMGKQRPRMGKGFAYTPKETVNYETLVKELFIVSKQEKVEGALFMELTAYYPIPQSKSKIKIREMMVGKIRPTVKPDADNVIKIICDSLNGLAYDDDKQIVSITFNKFYSDEPRVEVSIF